MSSSKGEDIFEGYKRRHYIGWLFSKIEIGPLPRALTVAGVSYVFFWIAVALGKTYQAVSSFIHVWQFFLSLTLFFAMWFADLALAEYKPWLKLIQSELKASKREYRKVVRTTLISLGSRKAFLLGLPFAVPGLLVASMISKSIPNDLFPFPTEAPVFIFVVYLQLCILMLHLLGDTGFWYLWIFTKSARELNKIESIEYAHVDSQAIRKFSQPIFRLCLWLFIILAAGMPGIAYVADWFGGIARDIVFFFGVVLPIVGLLVAYIWPNYYLNQILVRAYEKQAAKIKEELRLCERELSVIILEGVSKKGGRRARDVDRLLGVSRYLGERLQQLKKDRQGPFDIRSISRLLGSASIPIAAYYADRIITKLLEGGS